MAGLKGILLKRQVKIPLGKEWLSTDKYLVLLYDSYSGKSILPGIRSEGKFHYTGTGESCLTYG